MAFFLGRETVMGPTSTETPIIPHPVIASPKENEGPSVVQLEKRDGGGSGNLRCFLQVGIQVY